MSYAPEAMPAWMPWLVDFGPWFRNVLDLLGEADSPGDGRREAGATLRNYGLEVLRWLRENPSPDEKVHRAATRFVSASASFGTAVLWMNVENQERYAEEVKAAQVVWSQVTGDRDYVPCPFED